MPFSMSNLKSTIEDLAADFAMNIISALRSASIEELTGVSGVRRSSSSGNSGSTNSGRVGRPAAAPAENSAASRKSAPSSSSSSPAPRGRGGRLGRRSTADIESMVDSIVTLLTRAPEGLRAEQIRESLGVQAKELPRPLSDGLAAGKLRKSGQKRATTYYANDGGAKRGPGRPTSAKKKTASKKG